MPLRRRILQVVVIAAAIAASSWSPARLAESLPARLSDAEFWKLVDDLSESDGFFPSDNLVSNEDTFQLLLTDLQKVVKPGGVYVGVGPDQNFTYIAVLKPAMVFIPDVRRGNLHMHLMYKALMEQSADRADFLARLFSRKRPEGLPASAAPEQLFNAFAQIPPSRAMFDETLASVLTVLRKGHGFAITEADAGGIDYILRAFYSAGPMLSYASAPVGRGGRYPSFADLQVATDETGVPRAYLATEDQYKTVRALQQKNLIVPLVGNFAGPKTLRGIGAWVRERGARVTTFYTSNVEQYLFQNRVWDDFIGNLGALPVDETSTLIRSCFNYCVSPVPGSRSTMLMDSIPGLVRDHGTGQIATYFDVLLRRR